jgi:subtilisin-like proprotein convertase family protein
MRLFLPFLTGCSIGLTPVPNVSDSGGYPVLTDDTAALDETNEDDDSGQDGEDCVDADSDGIDTCSGDCDDDDSNTYPGAAEADSSTACMTDADGDGYGSDSPLSGVTAGTDCDDTNSNFSPSQTETPFDGVDSNCDGEDGGSTVSASGQGSLTINDNSTVNSTASVSGCPEILELQVSVNINHTYIGDLEVTLNAPSGQSVTLHNRTGGSTANINGTFSTTGGTLTPAQSLVPLLGSAGNGSWRLTITDNAYSDTGMLSAWGLEMSCL